MHACDREQKKPLFLHHSHNISHDVGVAFAFGWATFNMHSYVMCHKNGQNHGLATKTKKKVDITIRSFYENFKVKKHIIATFFSV